MGAESRTWASHETLEDNLTLRPELSLASFGAMHDVLRARVLRRIESLPEAQVYQVLDYIEFLESKYAPDLKEQTSGLQRLAEGLEDQLRKRAFNPSNLREAFQLIAAADRALSSVAQAGRELLGEVGEEASPQDPKAVESAGDDEKSEPEEPRDQRSQGGQPDRSAESG